MTVLTNDDLPVLQEKLVNVAYQWKQIGIQLGFDPGVLKGINDGLAGLLTRWLQRRNPPAMLQSLIDVVGGKVIANEVLAEKLKTECGDFPTIKKISSKCC